MKIQVADIQQRLISEYKMNVNVFPLGQDVTFFGSELDCYKMAHKFKNKQSSVFYSVNLDCWVVSFPEWFDVDFAQKIDN